MINTLKRIGSDKTFLVTFLLAVLSLMFGTVKGSDIDIKTVLALLSLIITVSIYENLNLLKHVADLIIEKCGTMRSMVFVILLFSFFGSMLFTNDVAILTLVPILFSIDQKIKIPKISIISLTTIYANLGSALTPIGNPQNLYLVSHYHLSLLKFFQMSLPIGCLSLISLVLCPFFFSKARIEQLKSEPLFLSKKVGIALGFTTIVVLISVLSLIPVGYAVGASLCCAFFVDKKVYAQIDYGIILTFVNFFIIVGAIGRFPMVHDFLTLTLLNRFAVFVSSVGISQVISNVPAAVLLSKFTPQAFALYLGVTVGGLGTLIASLANLLALRQYHMISTDRSTGKFFLRFSLLNVLYLAAFIGIGLVILGLI